MDSFNSVERTAQLVHIVPITTVVAAERPNVVSGIHMHLREQKGPCIDGLYVDFRLQAAKAVSNLALRRELLYVYLLCDF